MEEVQKKFLEEIESAKERNQNISENLTSN
jgi:hypothetical protein